MSHLLPQDIKHALEVKRDKQFTENEEKFLELYVKHEFDAKAAGDEMGLQRGQTYILSRRLKDEMVEIVQAKLVMEAGVAANTLANILTATDPVLQGELKFKAAQDILNRVGATKPQEVKHEHKHSGGIFVIPTKQPVVIDNESGETIDE